MVPKSRSEHVHYNRDFKFAKEMSANFRNVQHQKVHLFFWNRVYFNSLLILYFIKLKAFADDKMNCQGNDDSCRDRKG